MIEINVFVSLREFVLGEVSFTKVSRNLKETQIIRYKLPSGILVLRDL